MVGTAARPIVVGVDCAAALAAHGIASVLARVAALVARCLQQDRRRHGPRSDGGPRSLSGLSGLSGLLSARHPPDTLAGVHR